MKFHSIFSFLILILSVFILGYFISNIPAPASTYLPGVRTVILEGTIHPLGYQQIDDVSSATTLTVPDGAYFALIQPVTQNVRWRDDGTSPTASVGMQITAGNSLWYTGDLDTIEIIEETATAEVNITYYTQ